MRNSIFIILLLLALSPDAKCQSSKKINRYNISAITKIVTEYDNGDSAFTYTQKIIHYNKDGEQILEQEYEEDGNLQYELKWVFDEDGNEVEEIENYPSGKKAKEPYYEKKQRDFNRSGDEIEEREYNKDGELEKREVYSYDNMGNKISRMQYKKGELDEKTTYEVDEKGLRILETEYSPDGEIKKIVRYKYEFR